MLGLKAQRFEFQGVEGFRAGIYPGRVNTACTLYRIGDFLIDTGPPNQWRTVRRFISERGVQSLLLTHHHEDHAGNARRIHETTAARVFGHGDSVHLHREGYQLPFYRRLIWGKPYWGVEPEAFDGDLELSGGVVLRPIHTPGHSEDMTCFFEPNRGWVFTGDIYVSAQPRLLRNVEDPNQEIESLKLLLQLDFSTVFCAHRGVLEDGVKDIRRKLAYMIELREGVRELAAKGLSQKEVTRRLLGSESLLSYFSFFDFSKINFIRAFWPQDPGD